MRPTVTYTLIFIAALMVLAGCSNAKKEEQPSKTIQQIQKEKGVPVTIRSVEHGVIRRIERSNGTLEGIAEATLSTGMGGTVNTIAVAIGNTVKKDAVVAVMEIDGGSPVDVAQSAFDYAEKAYDRAKKLQEKGAISTEQVEGARVQYENAKRSLGQARVGVSVMAPFTGTVLDIFESVGSKVGAKTPLVKIADLSKMKIQMRVNEQAINFYTRKQKAFLLMDTDTIWGDIRAIALGANDMVHSFEVTARFSNPDRRLKPGMFKQVYTIVEEKVDVLYVPADIVNYDTADTPYLYRIENGVAVKTPITTGIHTGNSLEVLTGVGNDDKVIVSGLTMLSDGVKVNVVNQ